MRALAFVLLGLAIQIACASDAIGQSQVAITSDFGNAAGTGDVLVIEKPNVSARVYRSDYGTTVVFENGSLHGPQAIDRSGRYKIVVDGKTAFDGEMTLLPYGRSKHGPFQSGGRAAIVPQVTDEVVRRAHLHIGVDIPEGVLAGLPTSFPKKIEVVPNRANPIGTVPAYMPTGGANPNIGIVPAHAARALASRDPRAVKNTLAEADAFFTWPVHYRDEKTGRPPIYTAYPYASVTSSDHGDQIRGSNQKPFYPDTAHQAHPLFLAYLLTGEAYYLDEMLLWDFWNYLNAPDVWRNYAMSLVRTDSGYQTRAVAWVLIARGQLLSVLPRDNPSFAAIAASVEANARVYRGRFVDGTYDESTLFNSRYRNGGAKNNLGLFCSDPTYGISKDGSVLTSGWQNAFMVQMWAYLVQLDLPVSAKAKSDLDALMRFGFKYEKRLGRNGGWDVRRMGTYAIAAGTMVDGYIKWYADHHETWKHQTAELTPLPANSRLMVSHDSNAPLEGLGGFEGNEWPALAFAKMYGEDDGAWDAVVATDSFRQLAPGLDPQWAVFPPGLSVSKILKSAPAKAAVEAQPKLPPAPIVRTPIVASAPQASAPNLAKDDINWTHVVDEGQPFAFDRPTPVRYGADGHYIERTMERGVADNTTFGDPMVGVVKHLDRAANAPGRALDPAKPTGAAKPAQGMAQPLGTRKPTEVVKDTDGLEPSSIGSVATQGRPETYVHTIAYPITHRPRKKRFVAMPPGTGWREIPNTRLRAVATPAIGSGSLSAVVDNWTGGDFSEELQLFINPPGGGHFGNDNSTFYGFDVDALEVFEFYPPSPLQNPEARGDHAPAPEFPQATHIYDGSAWTTGRDGKPRFVFMGGRGSNDASDPHGLYPWIFDPEAITVEKGAPYQFHPNGIEGYTGLKAQGDPKRGVMYLQTTTQANQLSHYDAKRNRWFDHADRRSARVYGGQQLDIGYHSVLRIDPEHDIAVLLGSDDGLATLDLKRLKDGKPIGFQRVKKADELPLVTGDTAIVWDPIAKDWLCYGSKGVFSMDPVTWEMKLIDANGPKPERNGTFDRWFYSAKRDEFFTQNSVSNNWWAYKRQR